MTKQKLTTTERLLYFTVMFMTVVIVGAELNALAVKTNGNRMPVLNAVPFQGTIHFTYENPLMINNWLLTDILDAKWYIFSIGDVLVTIGVIGAVSSLIVLNVVRRRLSRKSEKPFPKSLNTSVTRIEHETR